MHRILMNFDTPVLSYDFEDMYLEVLNNDLLPYPMKDYIETTGKKDLPGTMHDINVVREFLANRTLLLSRENAKAILNAAVMPQSLRTDDRLKIVDACNGLTMQDNFWIRKDRDDRTFSDVCLRRIRLSEASYDIAILGRHISVTVEDLRPDLTTIGMFPKFWHRAENGDVEIWKTDRFSGKVHSAAEIEASEYMLAARANALQYRGEQRDGVLFSVAKCIADDAHSMVPAQDIRDWCAHTGKVIGKYIEERFAKEFANMCVSDYVVANTDRHWENWGFMVDGDNRIVDFIPLYDHNEALIFDKTPHPNTKFHELPYEPMNVTFNEAIRRMASYCSVDFGIVKGLPEPCLGRWRDVDRYIERAQRSCDDFDIER